MKIRTKTVVLFLSLSLIPLAVIGWLTYTNARVTMERDLGKSFLHLAHRTIGMADTVLSEVQNNARAASRFALMQEVISDDADGRISVFLAQLAEGYEVPMNFTVLNEAGDIISSNNTAWIGLNFKNEKVWEETMEGKERYYDAHPSMLPGQPMAVTFTYPIRAEFDQTKILGVFLMEWNLRQLEIITRMREKEGSGGEQEENIVIIRKDGFIVSAPGALEGFIFKTNLIEEGFESAKRAAQGKEGFIIESLPGVGSRLLVGYDHSTGHGQFPGFGWGVLVFRETEKIFSSIEGLKLQVLKLGGISAFLVIGVSLLLARRITKPLLELAVLARKIAGGDFSARANIAARDEIGQLAGAFNRMTENLRQTTVSRDYVDNIIGNMTNSLIVLTPGEKIERVNEATCRLLGYQEGGLLGQPFDLVYSKRNASHKNAPDILGTENIIRDQETSYRNKEGALIDVLFSSSPMKGQDGNVRGVICVAQDISERKKAEGQRTRLVTALQSVGDAIMITDIEGNVEYVNASFEKLTGFSSKEITGSRSNIFKSGRQADGLEENIWETLRRGNVWTGEIVNQKKDGSRFDAEATIGVVRDASFKVINYVAVLRDVTQRKKELAEQARMATALEAATEAISITDAEGVIQYVNPAFEQVTGYSHQEAIGKKSSLLKSGTQDKDFYKRLWDTILAGKPWRATIRNKKKDGTLFTAEQAIACVKDDSSKICNFVGVLHDITKRQETEDRLRKANEDLSKEQKAVRMLFKDLSQAHKELGDREKTLRGMFLDMQKAHEDLKQAQKQLLQSEKLASIGQLAAGVAHEINNPVGFISSNLQTLEDYVKRYSKMITVAGGFKESVKNKNWDEVDAALQAAEQASKDMGLDFVTKDMDVLIAESRDGIERIKKIVSDLRSFAREDEEVVEVVGIEEIIESILNIVRSEVQYKAEIKKEYGHIPPVKCNSRKIGQVFVNLVINASQAIEGKGTITIKTYCKDGYACVEVRDTGKGMEEHVIKRIFDPFFTTKPVGQGTGLGLSISYDIVKEHGGDIVVESEVGKGTAFIVQLPLKT